MFNNKTVLIFGGTGSFGHAFIDRIIKSKDSPKEIRVFSRDEKKQDDMRKLYNLNKIKFIIGDVRDLSSVDSASKKVDFVFHAAALKQVPSCEFYPMEAVKTNIIGTDNVLRSSIDNRVKKVICLSTDKAVYPINAMGISKAMMEKVAISRSLLNENLTEVCVTRYGNVMGSRGSVIPLLIKKIENLEPLTVTDMRMTRFMMTMDDALDLVIHAFKKGKNGELFIKKTPAATMGVLTEAILQLKNKNKKYPIQIIGSRHGEKMHETLLSKEDMMSATETPGYFVASPDTRDLNYEKFFTIGKNNIIDQKDYTSENSQLLSVVEMKKILIKSKILKL
jgi:UDP-N-acetylglucosamine 4,6-dehydratase/5-epimerase